MKPSIYVYRCQLTRVIDGDTVEAEIDLGFKLKWKTVIRFYGIDVHETRGPQASPKGAEATAFLRKLFTQQGSTFYLRSDRDEIAIYNRVAGWLYIPSGERFVDVIETMRPFEKGYAGDPAVEIRYITADECGVWL